MKKSILNLTTDPDIEDMYTIQHTVQQTTIPTLPNINKLHLPKNNDANVFLTDNLDYEIREDQHDNSNNLIEELADNKPQGGILQLDSNVNRNNYNYNMRLKKKTDSSAVEKQKKLFNKLYGINTFYINNCTKVKKNKNISLEQYQTNILNVLARQQIDQQHFINLNNKLKELRQDAELVTPLPPINFEEIQDKVRSQNIKKVKIKKMGYKDYVTSLNKKSLAGNSDNDEFNQVKFKYRSKAKPYNNKVFNNLPGYLIETIQKKMKLHL